MDILNTMYPKVVRNGFVIIDDYALKGCREAVHDFRELHGTSDEILSIDSYGVFWRKSTESHQETK